MEGDCRPPPVLCYIAGMRSLLVISIVLAAGLAFADTKVEVKADYDLVCNAAARSGAAKIKDPGQRAQKIASFLMQKIKTQKVKDFMASLGSMMPEDKGPALKKAAADAGYKGKCPLADMK